jgi:hypothetical protein
MYSLGYNVMKINATMNIVYYSRNVKEHDGIIQLSSLCA